VRATARGGVEESGRRRARTPTERARTDARGISDRCTSPARPNAGER
jgi:hypothetical protein